jgi:hypothetical protein
VLPVRARKRMKTNAPPLQPLVELYEGCMVVLKVSWCGMARRAALDALGHGLGEGRVGAALPADARRRGWARAPRHPRLPSAAAHRVLS